MPKKGQVKPAITDKQRAKVATLYLADPKQSTNAIAKKVGIGKSSVHRIITEELGNLGRTGDSDVISAIIDTDKRIIEKGTKLVELILDTALKEAEQTTPNPLTAPRLSHLNRIAAALTDSTKRHQLLSGKPTDIVRDADKISDDQRTRLLRRRAGGTVGKE